MVPTSRSVAPLARMMSGRRKLPPISINCLRDVMTSRPPAKLRRINNVAAAVGVAVDGTVKYEWQAADTDTAGEFDGEFEVTFGGGGIQTISSATDIRNTIRDEVA